MLSNLSLSILIDFTLENILLMSFFIILTIINPVDFVLKCLLYFRIGLVFHQLKCQFYQLSLGDLFCELKLILLDYKEDSICYL